MSDDADPPSEVTVGTLMAYAHRFGGGSPELASELAERLRLGGLRAARAGDLSRGERRRLALFGALCTRRPVIVLDEPLGVFDPLQLLQVLGLLRERARDGQALLLSIHQLSDAEKIADRILLLHEGCVLAFRSRDELIGSRSLEEAFLDLLRQEGDRAGA